MAGMDAAAALLANRTDCEYDSELNLDALLLGGFYCHACLPRNHGASCDAGGTCANVQWQGFTCDNEYYVDLDDGTPGNQSLVVSSLHYNTTHPKHTALSLSRGVTYRFTARTGAGQPVSIGTVPDFMSAISPPAVTLKSLSSENGVSNGPLLLTIDGTTPDCLYMATPHTKPVILAVGGTPDCPESPAGSLNTDNEVTGSPNTGNEAPEEDSTSSGEPSDEDNGGWFVAPEDGSRTNSALSMGGLSSVLIMVLHMVN